jgi:hypothetical protein
MLIVCQWNVAGWWFSPGTPVSFDPPITLIGRSHNTGLTVHLWTHYCCRSESCLTPWPRGRLWCERETTVYKSDWGGKGVVMVLNATFNNIAVISWWSVLLVDRRKPEYLHSSLPFTPKPPSRSRCQARFWSTTIMSSEMYSQTSIMWPSKGTV